MKDLQSDQQRFMAMALAEARESAASGEVPVGAVLVDHRNMVLATAGNSPISSCDPTAHAEIHVLRQAADLLKNYRLLETTMYVTLEPCVMCVGAMIHARVRKVVFGASDPKTGALISQYSIGSDSRLNHQLLVEHGVMGSECSALLRDFFKKRRK